ncbi:MAG: DUF1569 domain-containing protein [Planctomycetota bacterium]|nr:DUF1569 domain-containing protein [Planctomycetota bacterium]
MKKLPTPTADTPSFDDLRVIFERLVPEGEPRWGTMDRTQMVKHCRGFIDLYQGRVRTNFVIRGLARMIGGVFLKKVLAKSPMDTPKNMGTIPAIRAKQDESLDFQNEVAQLLSGFQEIESLSGKVQHPMYGQTHAEDIQALVRHHTAHHANQFGLLGS